MTKEKAGKTPGTEQHGVVVKWDGERGFGFIRPDDARGSDERDVFVHVRNVEGRRHLAPGQGVSYHVTRTEKGPAAINVRPGSVLATPYLKYLLIGLGSALLLLFGLAMALDRPESRILWLVMWTAAVSFAAFGLYGYDKAQAQRGGARVPEAILWLMAALGGSPGAFVAMRLFRHKTSKLSFRVVFWMIVAAQVGVVAFLLWRG